MNAWLKRLLMVAGVAAAAAPAAGQIVNADECVNATAISGLGAWTFDTRAATGSASPAPFPGSITMNYDVWARWTAPQTGWLTLSTCVNGTTSATVSVYRGADCAGLEPWAVGDYQACNSEIASFWVNAGETYTFRLDLPRRTGQFGLSYGEPFPGDDCHDAIVVSGTGLFAFDNSGATSAYHPDDPYQYVQNDVWYRWTAPESGPSYIHTCGTMVFSSPAIQLFEQDGCPAAGEIAFNAGAPGCGGARVDFVAEAGRTYVIRLGSTNGYARIADGAFEIVHVGGGGGGGEIITVDTTYDTVDITGAQNYDSLPGPDGKVSFREACIAANNTGGAQRIEFAIPQSEWYYPPTTFPYATIINASGDAFVLSDDGTVVDGATQTANIGDTNPNGPDVGFWSWNPNAGNSPNIIVSGSDCVLKDLNGAGLMGQAAWLNGDRNLVVGCFFTQGLQHNLEVRGDDNIVGGTEPGDANRIERLLIRDGAARTIVIGNRLIGVTVTEGAAATRLGGPTVAERNIIGGHGRYVGEGFPSGDQVAIGGGATATLVENNYIGVQADGATPISQVGPQGITVAGGIDTTIRNNVIAECRTAGVNHYAGQVFGSGVLITSDTRGTAVRGNLIGTDATGQNAIVNLVGVRVTGDLLGAQFPTGTTIGGAGPGEGNLVAFSERTGITIADGVQGATILGNSIHANGLLGIDLEPAGVTPNDPQDADSGANGLQNFPVLTSAGASDSQTTIAGSLNSTPGREFRVEFFASPACDPSGHGEGLEYLGATTLTTDTAGNASFTATLARSATAGWVATATATDLSTGDTSEFSACISIQPDQGSCDADFNADGVLSVADFTAFRAAFLAGDVAADFNGDGSLNVGDFTAFRAAFLAGCP